MFGSNGSACPPSIPPTPTDICVCAPRPTTWWFAWGVGSPVWHSHIDGGTTARPAARNLSLRKNQDGANLPENCDGACVLSGSSPFFHALMPCLYCGMPNGISIIFESAKCARCEFFSCLFELFCSRRGQREPDVFGEFKCVADAVRRSPVT